MLFAVVPMLPILSAKLPGPARVLKVLPTLSLLALILFSVASKLAPMALMPFRKAPTVLSIFISRPEDFSSPALALEILRMLS